MTIFGRPPELVDLKAVAHRDRYGKSTADAWGHCNLCPRPDPEPCPQACSNARGVLDAEDGIKVSHPVLAS